RASPAPVGLPTTGAEGRTSQVPSAAVATTPSPPRETTTTVPDRSVMSRAARTGSCSGLTCASSSTFGLTTSHPASPASSSAGPDVYTTTGHAWDVGAPRRARRVDDHRDVVRLGRAHQGPEPARWHSRGQTPADDEGACVGQSAV